MEVLKQGTHPDDKVFNGRCHYCAAEVRFRQSEGRITREQRDGDFITVRCPTCPENINVELRLGKSPEPTCSRPSRPLIPCGITVANLRCTAKTPCINCAYILHLEGVNDENTLR